MTVGPGGGRPAAVAGGFYPAEPARLAGTVDALLSAADPGARDGGPRAVVVPHAGYRYSGPVAAAAYALLRGWSPARVVLLGPAHFVPLSGSAVPRAAQWWTPLGPVPVDPAARDRALAVRGVHADDGPHDGEHALEVQLPFLQRSVGTAPAVPPAGAGTAMPPAGGGPAVLPVATAAPPEDVADLLDAVAADPGTLVVASTDLSHYLPEAAARDRDGRTIEAVLALRPDRVGPDSACGRHALRGLLTWARRTGATPALLAYGTSADGGGDPRRVVGYAAFALR